MQHHLPLRNKLIIMMSVMASLFLVALDQTIISTALGRIVEDFHSFSSLSWIVTAYLLTTTITVPIAGKLSDLFGRRLMLLMGVAIFGAGSLLSGMAGDVNQLILFRALQGIGAGIITANAFTIIGDLFAARERGKWQGLFGAVFGLSSLIGPFLGGWLTDGITIANLTTDWRWTFFINVPVAIVAFIVITIFCPTLKHSRKPVIDYAGAALLTVALGTLVLAVDNTEQIFKGLLDTTGMDLLTLRIIMYSIVAIATVLFIWVERRVKEPILPLRLFQNRTFVLVMAIAVLFGAAFMGAILYLTQFNQQVFGASPTESGLMLLPMIAGLMLTSIVSGQIISKTGRYKIFMQVGIVIATLMVGLLTTLTPETPYIYEAAIMVLLGAGLGVVMPIMNLAVQNEFEQQDLGVATSSSQLFRSLGSTIGIAVLGAMLTHGLTSNLANIQNDSYLRTLSQNPEVQAIGDLQKTDTLLNLNMPDTKEKISQSFIANSAALPNDQRQQASEQFYNLQTAYANKIAHAFSDSLRLVFTVSGTLMLIATVLVFMIKERPLRAAHPEQTPGEM